MGLTVTTDHDAIRARVTDLLEADPVRHTVLGTIAQTLSGTAWAAVAAHGLAVRSEAAHPVVVVGSWADAERAELAALLTGLGDVAGIGGAEPLVAPLAPVLGPDPRVERQRLFRLDELVAPVGVAGRAVVGADGHRAFVRASFAAFFVEAHEQPTDTDALADRALDAGQAHVWLDPAGEPVSLAARRAALAGSARIGPVYTPPARRGHGYASGVTAHATASILAEQAVPVLFTDLANPTSNKIYAALGYRPVEDRVVIARRPGGPATPGTRRS